MKLLFSQWAKLDVLIFLDAVLNFALPDRALDTMGSVVSKAFLGASQLFETFNTSVIWQREALYAKNNDILQTLSPQCMQSV